MHNIKGTRDDMFTHGSKIIQT